MEKEQIIKALECISRTEDVLCEGCSYRKYDGLACHRIGAKNALALIKELTEENERLTKQIEMSEAAYQELQFAFSICANQVKADTVREMQERFKELMGGEFASCGYCNAVGYWSVQSVKKCIDRIANKILNENTEE